MDKQLCETTCPTRDLVQGWLILALIWTQYSKTWVFTRDLGMPYTLNVHVLNNYIVQHAHEHAIFSILKHKWRELPFLNVLYNSLRQSSPLGSKKCLHIPANSMEKLHGYKLVILSSFAICIQISFVLNDIWNWRNQDVLIEKDKKLGRLFTQGVFHFPEINCCRDTRRKAC